jgi:predicted transposase YbfD/YdcC
MIEQKQDWMNLQSLVRIQTERCMKSTGETERETRYYISSLLQSALLLNQQIRAHWKIKNSLHWVLDVAFNEDQSRKRAGHAAQNYTVLNRIARNLLKNEKTSKRSVKGKRLKAGWDNDYRVSVLKI